MEKFLIGLKREYWEYKRILFGVPICLSLILFLAATMATLYAEHIHEWAEEKSKIEQSSETSKKQPWPDQQAEQGATLKSGEPQEGKSKETDSIEVQIEESPLEFVSIYLAFAWFVSLYYLLSSLYLDRRDNSILYWKSLPVSETASVLIKLTFGLFAFTLAALLAAWVTFLLLDVFGLGSVEIDQDGNAVRPIDQGLQPVQLFIWPLHGLVAGVLWGAPVFAFMMMISAMAKRSRFLLLIVPVAVVAACEAIIFRSSSLVLFFMSHMPHAMLERLQAADSLGQFWGQLFGPQLGSLLLGLIIAAGFLIVAIWHRNNRFEV